MIRNYIAFREKCNLLMKEFMNARRLNQKKMEDGNCKVWAFFRLQSEQAGGVLSSLCFFLYRNPV
jgi:hypothetical protein